MADIFANDVRAALAEVTPGLSEDEVPRGTEAFLAYIDVVNDVLALAALEHSTGDVPQLTRDESRATVEEGQVGPH